MRFGVGSVLVPFCDMGHVRASLPGLPWCPCVHPSFGEKGATGRQGMELGHPGETFARCRYLPHRERCAPEMTFISVLDLQLSLLGEPLHSRGPGRGGLPQANVLAPEDHQGRQFAFEAIKKIARGLGRK